METPEYVKEALKVLNDYKAYFGFADWEIRIDDKTESDEEETYAEADPDFLEKTLTVTIFPLYLKSNRKETMIHELIHGRIAVAANKIERKVEQIEYYEEEEAVNDITRGFMKIIEPHSEKIVLMGGQEVFLTTKK